MSDSIRKLKNEVKNDMLQRIEELEAQCEALQNKCARRGLSPEDSDALEAAMKYTGTELGKAREDNERLRAVYEAAKEIVDGPHKNWPKLREAVAAVEEASDE